MPKKSYDSQVATKGDIKRLGHKIEVKLDKIANTLDGFVGVVDNLRIDNEVGANQIRELDVKVDDHEKRITQLESPAT